MSTQLKTNIVYSNTIATSGLYKGIELTTTTKDRRDQVKVGLDKFTSFSWCGYDAWNNFGAFIVADKAGDLKMYNGSSFSNEYTAPQFSSSVGNLMGVTFKRQTIAFKVGVYWITMEDYRRFLDWLNPRSLGYLKFGFNSSYQYYVKLAKIEDSPKYPIGEDNSKTVYYTELTLNWEVQGLPCAYSSSALTYTTTESTNTSIIYKLNTATTDLKTPILYKFRASLSSSMNYKLQYKYGTGSYNTLFDVTLQHLDNLDSTISSAWLIYDSSNGQILFETQDSNNQVLSTTLLHLAIDKDGNNILSTSSFTINKWYIDGCIENYGGNTTLENYYFDLEGTRYGGSTPTLTIYSRTNIA